MKTPENQATAGDYLHTEWGQPAASQVHQRSDEPYKSSTEGIAEHGHSPLISSTLITASVSLPTISSASGGLRSPQACRPSCQNSGHVEDAGRDHHVSAAGAGGAGGRPTKGATHWWHEKAYIYVGMSPERGLGIWPFLLTVYRRHTIA